MSDPTDACLRLFGTGELAAAFGGGERLVTPWRPARREKRQRLVEPTVIDAVSVPARSSLRSTRASFVARSRSWLPNTSAGTCRASGSALARRRGSREGPQPLSAHLAGPVGRPRHPGRHHRAIAALIEGRPLRVRTLRPADATPTAVLPRLLVAAGDPVSFPHTGVDDPATVAALVNSGTTAVVPTMELAAEALELLGLAPELIEDRLAMALRNRCRLAA